MPHIIVKLATGRSEQQKQRLSDAVTQAVVASLALGEDAVSVSLEEVDPVDWTAKVYMPNILNGPGKLYKKPGYEPR